MDLAERREWLESELGRELPEAVWNELVGEKRVWTGDMTWDDDKMLVTVAMS